MYIYIYKYIYIHIHFLCEASIPKNVLHVIKDTLTNADFKISLYVCVNIKTIP